MMTKPKRQLERFRGNMNLNHKLSLIQREISNKPLAIQREYFESISLEAFISDDEKKEEPIGAQTTRSVLRISMEGVIQNKVHACSWLMGYCPLQAVKQEIMRAMDEEEIDVLVLDMDSPGGGVDGLEEFNKFLMSIRDKVTIYAVANSLIASAAYWVASAAHKIYLSSKLSAVGSIGVFATHVDLSEKNEKEGRKVTEIASTPMKTLLSPNKPLDEEGKKYLQEQVDFIHSRFVSTVASNRAMEEEEVRTKLATGLTYFGDEAIAMGLADGYMEVDELIETSLLGKDDVTMSKLSEINDMSAFEKEHPEFYARVVKPALLDANGTGFEAGHEQATAEEIQRMKDIDDATYPGFEEEAKKAKYEDKVSAKDFALTQAKTMKEKGLPSFNPLAGGQKLTSDIHTATQGQESDDAEKAALKMGMRNKAGALQAKK